MLIQKNICRV